MHRSPSLILAVFLLLTLSPPAAPAQSLNEVLDGVSRNVALFQASLPDFVCHEKITSTRFESGKLIQSKVVDSVFTGVQQAAEENRLHFAFVESRDVAAIDGKPVRKGTMFPKLPYRFAGGFSSLLITTFAPENLAIHNYTIADSYKSETTSEVLVRFATKEDQQKLRGIFQGTQLVAKDTGAAWVDQKTFHVLRLQRQSLNLPASLSKSMASADYGSVTIGEREFWMPKTIRAEVSERNTRVTVRYLAEYTDCKMFMTDIKILP
jgi:hypothetical protein